MMNSSVPAVKSSRILDKMPKNLYDVSGQEILHSVMQNTFHKKSGSAMDTEAFGFEQPAGNQLNRINKKLERWEVQARNNSEKKVMRDIWAKEILKKEEKKSNKIQKYYETEKKIKDQEWKDYYEKRDAKLNLYEIEQRNQRKETMAKVKEYYQEVKQFHLDKKRKELEIYAKMMEVYDSYKGEKAKEQERRAQEYLEMIEEGQVKAAEVEKKLLEKIEMAKNHKMEVSAIRMDYNMNVQPLKAIKAQEISDKKQYDSL